MQKRAAGVFYTPADVAEYMVNGCLDSLDSESAPIVYDPACGTGVFLRVALRELKRRYKEKDLFSLASECLFGTDVAPWSLDASAFLLLADILVSEAGQKEIPAELWCRLRLNLKCIDTLLVDPIGTDSETSSTTQSDIIPGSVVQVVPSYQGRTDGNCWEPSLCRPRCSPLRLMNLCERSGHCRSSLGPQRKSTLPSLSK